MKIDINLVGATEEVPDYEMLKAALLAAQASTPTARASREAPPALAPRDALDQLFGGAASSDQLASSLDHRFAPGADTSGDAA